MKDTKVHAMTNLAAKVHRLAKFLDGTGKPDAPIRTTTSRGYLLRVGIRPEKRGGPLFVGEHPVTYRETLLKSAHRTALRKHGL